MRCCRDFKPRDLLKAVSCVTALCGLFLRAQGASPAFNVIAFYSGTKDEQAHFRSAPNEWYKWANDLRTTSNIKILVSIDPSSYPLGTGPKAHEIWHGGYYPVVWSNQRYRMLYFNMGHNDLDFDQKPNKELSWTFANETQNRLVLDGLLWLGSGNK